MKGLLRTAEEKKVEIASHIQSILDILGIDTSTLQETPTRVATMYVDELFAGLDPNHFPPPTYFEEGVRHELISIYNLSFTSICEHHLLPFIGKVHVAYYPHHRLLGFSTISQLVRHCAKRPQLQERLTHLIASSLSSYMETEDVAVCIQAIHFCMIAQGVEEQTAHVETIATTGRFAHDSSLLTEWKQKCQGVSFYRSV